MRVIGIDPGTVSIDLCGLEDGRVFLDRTIPTADALADPARFVALLEEGGLVDVVAGPSGYGLPLVAARDASEEDLRLAFLAAEGEQGGIGGLRGLVRMLARTSLPVMLTPAVLHLPSVPAHRKVNRIDMGTADKVCAAALGVHAEAARLRCAVTDVSFLLLELGGAFTAALAVDHGRIVDGVGGSSGPMGMRASGALDGEVAFLAGSISKGLLFTGGAASVAGLRDPAAESLAFPATPRTALAWEAYLEGAVKAVAALATSVPTARVVLLSGRLASVALVRDELEQRLAAIAPGFAVHALVGFAASAKHAAQGAALIADGLAGGASAALVDALGIREASGTVLDHLYVISRETARARLGLA